MTVPTIFYELRLPQSRNDSSYHFTYNLIEELSEQMQVIFTDHANIDEDWFSNSIVERWRDGVKLIPSDW
jgi:hypothetical protein